MIVLLDIERQVLTLYGKKGMVEMPFTQAASMYDYLEGDNVLYITNAMEVSASEVLNVIKGMGVVIQNDIVQETGFKYLHAPGEESIYIEEHLQFKGKYDCKRIDEVMTQIIEKNPILQNLIRAKKIEIIGERKRASLKRQQNQRMDKKIQDQDVADAKLSGIIMDTAVADWDGSMTGVSGHESAIVVDLNKGGRVGTGSGGLGPSFNTMSELMDNIDGLEG
jgi:hypothetical protein